MVGGMKGFRLNLPPRDFVVAPIPLHKLLYRNHSHLKLQLIIPIDSPPPLPSQPVTTYNQHHYPYHGTTITTVLRSMRPTL